MLEQYEYLQKQIQGNTWIGKEALPIGPPVHLAFQQGQLWFNSLNEIHYLHNSPLPLDAFRQLLTREAETDALVRVCSLLFLESSYGVNLAHNSRKYPNLATTAHTKLSQLKINPKEAAFYVRTLNVYNETLNLPQLGELLPQLNFPGKSAWTYLEDLQTEKVSLGSQILNWLQSAWDSLSTLVGTPRRSLQRQIRTAQKALATMDSPVQRMLVPSPVSLSFAPIVIAPSPSLQVTTSALAQIAHWIVSAFIPGQMAQELLNALSYCAASITAKFFQSDGAEICRYISADFLRKCASFLPRILARTGMGATAWNTLMVFAPIILIAAILTIMAVRRTQETHLGEWLYVFGLTSNDEPDFSLSKVINEPELQIRQQLLQLAQELIQHTGHSYRRLLAFVTHAHSEEEQEVNLTWDLTQLNHPVTLSKEEGQTLFNQLLPLTQLSSEVRRLPPTTIQSSGSSSGGSSSGGSNFGGGSSGGGGTGIPF